MQPFLLWCNDNFICSSFIFPGWQVSLIWAEECGTLLTNSTCRPPSPPPSTSLFPPFFSFSFSRVWYTTRVHVQRNKHSLRIQRVQEKKALDMLCNRCGHFYARSFCAQHTHTTTKCMPPCTETDIVTFGGESYKPYMYHNSVMRLPIGHKDESASPWWQSTVNLILSPTAGCNMPLLPAAAPDPQARARAHTHLAHSLLFA